MCFGTTKSCQRQVKIIKIRKSFKKKKNFVQDTVKFRL